VIVTATLGFHAAGGQLTLGRRAVCRVMKQRNVVATAAAERDRVVVVAAQAIRVARVTRVADVG
jgi:hypothetical protein